MSTSSLYQYERQMASLTKQYTINARQRDRKEQRRRETLADAAALLSGDTVHNNSRIIKKRKMKQRLYSY